MEEIRPNSDKSKIEANRSTLDQKPQKVDIQVVRKTKSQEVVANIVGSDDKTLGQYILKDWLEPEFKKMATSFLKSGVDTVSTLAKNAIDMWIMKKITGSNSPKSDRTNYSKQYKSTLQIGRDDTNDRESRAYDYGDIRFASREQANACLDQLEEIIADHGYVTVATLYQVLKHPEHSKYTDNYYGWFSISRAEVVGSNADGWTLIMPRAVSIQGGRRY